MLHSTDIVQIASGHAFNLVLTKEGKVFCWGRNEQGQLGLGGGISMDVYSMEAVPLIVEALQGACQRDQGMGKREGWT